MIKELVLLRLPQLQQIILRLNIVRPNPNKRTSYSSATFELIPLQRCPYLVDRLLIVLLEVDLI